MFLLSKLDEVPRRFPGDVEGIREFLHDRGIPAGSLQALTHFSARLAIDPSFRRDLTSLVQVVIRREDEAVDYMDLLGILVAAAAGSGPFHANDEQEESVREILRFLTQIRRPTGAVAPVFVRSRNVIPDAIGPEPVIGERASLPVRAIHDVAASPTSAMPFFRAQEESEPSRRRGAAVWIAGGIALAVALGAGWMLYPKGRPAPQPTAARIVQPTGSPVSPSLPIHEDNEPPAAPAIRVRKAPAPVVRKPSPAVARRLNELRTPRTESPMTEQVAPVRRLRTLNADEKIPPVKLSAPAQPAVVAETLPPARPPNVVAESAVTSTPPVNTPATNTPGVRRRLPKSVVINPGPPRQPAGSSGSLNASAPGIVHPASIGMMASNLISSPAPAYPVAASQARVQGEVTVRAVIDRQGNVIDARVVSGPELLRDASLEAVQHWRYRPYMQGGRPVEVATTAVLDFELP